MDEALRAAHERERPHALVWIDSKEAIVVRWEDDQARIDRVTSVAPDHRESAGHARHDPGNRCGGGRVEDTEESRRHEFLNRFLKDVTHRLPHDADLTVLGPGETHEHLVKVIRTSDVEHHHARRVAGRRSSRKTDRQLVALLRELGGEQAPRRMPSEVHPSRSRSAEAVR